MAGGWLLVHSSSIVNVAVVAFSYALVILERALTIWIVWIVCLILVVGIIILILKMLIIRGLLAQVLWRWRWRRQLYLRHLHQRIGRSNLILRRLIGIKLRHLWLSLHSQRILVHWFNFFGYGIRLTPPKLVLSFDGLRLSLLLLDFIRRLFT